MSQFSHMRAYIHKFPGGRRRKDDALAIYILWTMNSNMYIKNTIFVTTHDFLFINNSDFDLFMGRG